MAFSTAPEFASDQDLIQRLSEFPRRFRSGRIREFRSMVDEVVSRKLPISEELHQSVRQLLETKLAGFRARRAKTSKYVLDSKKNPDTPGFLLPASVRIELAELLQDDQTSWENGLRDSLQAWEKFETTRPRIGSIRRRR